MMVQDHEIKVTRVAEHYGKRLEELWTFKFRYSNLREEWDTRVMCKIGDSSDIDMAKDAIEFGADVDEVPSEVREVVSDRLIIDSEEL